MSIIKKRGYQGYTYDKVTVNLILDFILSTFCSYTSLSIALWKEQQWENLMQNLRSILFNNKNTKKILRHVKICFARMATNLVILILIYSFWANHFGPYYYSQRYGILYIELLLVYSFNTFLSLILNILLTQYQYLNHQLDEEMGCKMVCTQKLIKFVKKRRRKFVLSERYNRNRQQCLRVASCPIHLVYHSSHSEQISFYVYNFTVS
jgi:hypothetical protein